ncbi:beta-ketoacyl synthase chain length factor [Antarcticibacterium flavum]|uniref:Beta-ketoacyl synthase chain length factor n=1 Tax=Antarcticibacterium flavum TaxID=2058175 RepID=A0A5B7X0F9_9FLAO|nr:MULTISPECIES: beta-ketoacyl synthase chain length factor [Antarcticibacterium]MCM4158827.1 3-oxoacyl-ACP synthase [Antarcticibacterium sp. W02-3]QCY68091.1 beta-ketoacyl synthase chain length factor [Antarcticibacterium flavum]
MRDKIYINGIAGISAQPEAAVFSGEITGYVENIFSAVAPHYKEYIPAMQLRRMSTGIKMGLTAAKISLNDAGVEVPDAIITGTGEGAKQDTEKFLQAMLVQQEEMLSPTSFIQSTHNTIGGQIALNLKCNGYNMTYSQISASLESALADSLLLLREDPTVKNVLAGGVDEISEKITGFQKLDGQVKKERVKNLDLLMTDSPGTIISEGAHFFSLSSEKKDGSYAVLRDVEIFNAEDPEEVSKKISAFLQRNSVEKNETLTVFFGKNGDNRFDYFYTHLQRGIFSEKNQLAWKHLAGDYDTSTGFAIKTACEIFKAGYIPEILKLNIKTPAPTGQILIYNQYLGENHSLVLLSSP